jgi:hypothetical protein
LTGSSVALDGELTARTEVDLSRTPERKVLLGGAIALLGGVIANTGFACKHGRCRLWSETPAAAAVIGSVIGSAGAMVMAVTDRLTRKSHPTPARQAAANPGR